jgi:SAM-dependent methyltransferase
VTDVWSERAEAFRESPVHREGPDLDLLVEWCEPGAGVTALDVATGGGHVARRLREAGCTVVTVDPAPGMQPDVVARGEDLPFADATFDVVTSRIAPHHFADVRAAVREMARVSRDRVVVEDNLFGGEHVEEAERLRDPTHVRCYSEDEWRSFFAEAGLDVESVERFERRQDVEAWLARVETPPQDAARVRELLADEIEDGRVLLRTIVLKGRKT